MSCFIAFIQEKFFVISFDPEVYFSKLRISLKDYILYFPELIDPSRETSSGERVPGRRQATM